MKTLDDDADPPNPATNLRVTAWDRDDGATIEWDLPASQPPGVTVAKWILQYREPFINTDWNSSDPLAVRRSAFTSLTTDLLGDLSSHFYDVRVVLESAEGAQAFSEVLAVNDIQTPVNLRVDGSVGRTEIPLAWDLPAWQSDWLTVNNVLVQRDDSGTWTMVATLAADATSTTLTGLSADTAYRLRVAYDTSFGVIGAEVDGTGNFRTAKAGLVFTFTPVIVDEDGTAPYRVELDARPSADVTVAIASSDTGAATVAPSSLTFTTANWSEHQVVTVTGVQDADTDDETPTLTHSIGGAQVASVPVTVRDDEVLHLVYLNVDNPADRRIFVEEGGTKAYDISLSRDISAAVTVALESGDTGAVTVSPATVTFTQDNMDTPVTVTVRGVEDADDLHETVTVTHSATGVRTNTMTVLVRDDEADPPKPATGLHTTQWHSTLGATLAWDLPAQPPGVTIERTIVEIKGDVYDDWTPAHESTKAIRSYGPPPAASSDHNLINGLKARVVLVSTYGQRAVSAELTLLSPSLPTNLRLDGARTPTTVPLAWDLPASQPPGVTVNAVVIQQRPFASGSYADVLRLAADATSATVTGLTAGTRYDFRVVLETDRGRALSPTLTTLGDSAPRGSLSVSGGVAYAGGFRAFIGDTLTAVTSGLTDENGLSNPNWRFQWYRADSNVGSTASTIVSLDGSTGRTYTVAAADASTVTHLRQLYYVATYTDDAGFTRTIDSK